MKTKIKLDYDSLLIYLLFLYPIVTIIINIINKIIHLNILSINQYATIILLLTYYLIIRKKLYFKSLLIPFLILYILNIVLSSNPWTSIRDIMFVNLVINLSILFYSGKFKVITINEKLKSITFAITLAGFYIFILGIDLMKSQYIESYHAGLFILPHTAAYYLLFIFIYTTLIDNKFNVAYFLSFIGIILTGVRTAIIALFIFIFIYLLSKKINKSETNSKHISKFLFTIAIILLFIIIIRPSITENVILRMSELTNFNNIDNYGSGRVSISKFIFSDFEKRNFIEIMIGKPVIEEYIAAQTYFGVSIWAHNDFTMILYTLGILGLIIYSYYIIVNPIKYLILRKSINKNKSLFLQGIGLVILINLLAISNGFYFYLGAHAILYILLIIPQSAIIKISKENKK